MCKVRITVLRVYLCLGFCLTTFIILVNFPSLHNGLQTAGQFDLRKWSSEKNIRATHRSIIHWTPVSRLYADTINLSESRTEVTVSELRNVHFGHVQEAIDNEMRDSVSNYLRKLKSANDREYTGECQDSGECHFKSEWQSFVDFWNQSLQESAQIDSKDSWLWGELHKSAQRANSRHFVSEIKGIRVHYIVTAIATDTAKNKAKESIGVLLVNGWPSNVLEWLPFVEDLYNRSGTENMRPMHLVSVSLPQMGTGFSESVRRDEYGDFNVVSVASILSTLMEEKLSDLFSTYVVCATDWGAIIAEIMVLSSYQSRSKRQNVKKLWRLSGVLTGFPISYPPLFEAFLMQLGIICTEFYLQAESHALIDTYNSNGGALPNVLSTLWGAIGYQHWFQTRPHTAAYALSASPVSFCAVAFDAFNRWTALKGPSIWPLLASVCTLANANSGGVAAGIAYYRESVPLTYRSLLRTSMPSTVPFAVSVFEKDPFNKFTANRYLEMRYSNLVQLRRHDSIGHFPAFENPHAFAGDLIAFLQTMQRNKVYRKREL